MQNHPNFKIVAGIFVVILIYIVLYFVFINSAANEIDKTLYDSVSNIMSVIVGVTTMLLVYRTYIAQKRDGEFNRVLDAIYRQLESSYHVKNRILAKVSLYKSFALMAEFSDGFRVYVGDLKQYILFHRRILAKSNLNYDDQRFLFRVFFDNIPFEIVDDILMLNQITFNYNAYSVDFRKYYLSKRVNDKIEVPDGGSRSSIKNYLDKIALDKLSEKDYKSYQTDVRKFEKSFRDFQNIAFWFSYYKVYEDYY